MEIDLSDFGEIVEGVNYLTVKNLTIINAFLIQEQTPNEPIAVLKPNELASSQARPAQYRYHCQTDDMFKLASVLMESLVLNHPFANANKRTAFLAGYVFLLLNGYELTAPTEDIIEIMVGLSVKTICAERVEDWLCYWSRDFDSRNLCLPSVHLPDTLFQSFDS